MMSTGGRYDEHLRLLLRKLVAPRCHHSKGLWLRFDLNLHLASKRREFPSYWLKLGITGSSVAVGRIVRYWEPAWVLKVIGLDH